MTDSIKITALSDIGSNIGFNSLLPVVNMNGTPTTQKSNLQNMGNLILSSAGGSYFVPAAQALLAQTVTNAAQPNITSVGTLSTLTTTGNITVNAGGYFIGDGGYLSNVIGSTGNITFNGDNIQSTNDVVNILVNGNRWIFNDSGYMEIPNDGSFGALNSSILAFSSQNNKPIFIEVLDTGNSIAQQWVFDNAGNLTLPGNTFAVNYANGDPVPLGGASGLPISNGTSNINIATADGNVTIVANGETWTFDPSGNLTIPGNVNLPLVAKLNSGGIGVTNAAEFGTEVTVDGSNIINGSQIYMGAGTAESRAIVNSTGNSLMYTGVENPGFAGTVAVDPGVTSEYAIQVGSNNQIEIGAVVGPITTTEYVAGLGVLNATGNINGMFANANVTVIGSGDLGWSFDNNGNLTLPGNLVISGNTSVFGTDAALIQPTNDLPLLSISSGANGAVSSVWVEDIGNVSSSNIAAVYANPTPGSGIVRIAVGQNGGGGPNLWDFDASGNLTAPGDIGANSGSFAGAVTAQIVISTPTTYASLPTPVMGARALITDANIPAAGNFGAQVGAGGFNKSPVWSDGTNWYIG